MKHFILAVLPIFLLAACADYTPTPKKPVNIKEDVHVLAIDPLTQSVSDDAWWNLQTDIAKLTVEYMTKVEIETNAPAFHETEGYKQLYWIFYDIGFDKDKVVYRYTPMDGDSIVEVRVHHKVVGAPAACPDWRHSAIVNHDNSVMSNHGCATATNVSLMVADKNDLLKGQSDPRAVTDTAVRAVERYYSGEVQVDVDNKQTSARED